MNAAKKQDSGKRRGRQPKKGILISCYLREDLAEDLAKYNEQTGIPKTRMIEDALDAYFKNYSRIHTECDRVN